MTKRVAGLYFLFLVKVIDNVEKKGAMAEYITQSFLEVKAPILYIM